MFKMCLISTLVSLVMLTGCSEPEFGWNLTVFNAVANTSPEFPEPDNSDWLNPDYTSSFKYRKPGKLSSWFNNFFSSLGFEQSKRPEDRFLELLESTIENRNQKDRKKIHVLVVKPRPNSSFYVWGDLKGAYHSLVRDLVELKNRNIIDDSLKITQKDTYFVFNGNQIDRSAYSLETLALIMVLMNQNPDHVIYIAGRHEINDTWRDYSTWKELWVAFCDELNLNCTQDGNGIPYGAELLSEFFKTLPLSLYVVDSNENEPRALKFHAHEHSIEGHRFDGLVSAPTQYSELPTELFWNQEPGIRESPVRIDAVIRSTSRSLSFRSTDGLEMLEPENGAISWSSLSSPTLSNRNLFNFENDAFVQVNIDSQINNSTISLLTQNAITKEGFQKKTFHILSGRELTKDEVKSPPSIPDYRVPFGSTFDLSSVSSVLGQRIMSGIDLRIRKQNRNDEKKPDHKTTELDNKILRFYITDDRSRSDLAQKNVAMLMANHNVHSLIAPAGIGTTESLTSMIQDGRLSVFFPNSGTQALRKPNFKSLINLRTSFTNESCALVRYAKEVLKKNKFAIGYQDDDFGRESLAAATKLLKEKYKATDGDICAVPYEPDTLDLEEPASKLKACNAHALLLLATFSAADAFVMKIGLEALADVTILGLSHISDALQDNSDLSGIMKSRAGLQVVISRVVPNPEDTSLHVVRQYKSEMDREYEGAHHNPDSLEAYIATSLVMRTMEGIENPTREKLIAKFEGLSNTKYQDLHFHFNPQTRELLDELWLDTGSPNWINLKSANTLCNPSRDTNSSWKH